MSEWRIVLDGSTVPSREEIGNKARSIALMRHRGLPVPPAFVLPTSVGRTFNDAGGKLPAEAWEAVRQGIRELEAATGRAFGGSESPLLVSVRSGAAQSMPGMMDTILNLGMNDEVEAVLARETGDDAFARDTHRRFIESYAKTVLRTRLHDHEDMTPAEMRAAVQREGRKPIPEEPYEQLRGAIGAVFSSWKSPRAKAYRRHWNIPEEGGTAVTVQAMVFGNLDEASGTGVFFTRNPHSGEPEPYGEFLPRGQGEDVVSGEVQPLDLDALRQRMPEVHEALMKAGRVLERDAGDVQDVEFTVERGRLYLLQTRAAKRSPAAAVRLAVELVTDGVAEPQDALKAVRSEHIEAVLEPVIDPEARRAAQVLARGEPACPGVASGMAVGDADEAELVAADGTSVILVRRSTSPEDIHGMIAAKGVCTEVGGRTSHAAVVSRELGRPAVVGCGEGALQKVVGRMITIDGSTGEVFDGQLPTRQPALTEHAHLAQLAAWAFEHREVIGHDHPLLTRVAGRAETPPAPNERSPEVAISTKTYETLVYQADGPIATITLNRPDHLNTIVPPMTDELEAAVAQAVRDGEVKVIVLRGAGRAFCAGFNFSGGFRQWDSEIATEGRWDPGRDFIMTTSPVTGWVPKFMSLWHSPKPVIAMVHGWCVGGGSEMALCSDIVLMSEDARIGTPYSRMWGAHHAGMWVYRLGLARAKELALTGRSLSGKEAAEIGLVNRAVPFEQLEGEAYKLARQLSSIPLSQLTAMKLVVNQAYENMGLKSTQLLGSLLDGMLRNTPEAIRFIELAEREGVGAAVAERDGPFDDYSVGPREGKPDPSHSYPSPS